MVPSTEISPTTSSASVMAPWAPSPAVAASRRMISRMAGPVTRMPAQKPPTRATPTPRR